MSFLYLYSRIHKKISTITGYSCTIIKMHSKKCMIEFYQLEELVTLKKEGTLSKTAEKLNISQPAITRSMQRLEDDLGVPLFERKKNKIVLNENGELAVTLAKQILDSKENMVETLQTFELSKKEICIGSIAPAPMWILHETLEEKYPKIKIQEDLIHDENELLNGLESYKYPIVISMKPIKKDGYESIKLFSEQLFISLPPAHPLASLKEVSYEDINGESVLLLSKIGYWNEITIRNIPDSHLLIQEDQDVFTELTQASALPYFRSNITLDRQPPTDNRVILPITDSEAKATYYATYHVREAETFHFLKNYKFKYR